MAARSTTASVGRIGIGGKVSGMPVRFKRARRDEDRYPSPPMVKVGGEVNSFCTRCEMTLAHTVHAVVDGRPVKVECNTCHGVHRFRGDAPGASTSPRPARSTTTPRPARERVTISFDEVLRGKNLAMARRYSPKASYQLDDVIEH